MRTAHEILTEAVVLLPAWYSVNRRPLPWRQDPTPYHTWIAEIMLQQTRIEAVIPYYLRFLNELPDVPALAVVEEDRLLKLWEGLGYYSRARNLRKAAQILMEHHDGELPASLEALKKLPGIGEYTAGSIASIAFGLPEPAVDGNVLRVLARLCSSAEDITSQSTKYRVISSSVTSSSQSCRRQGYVFPSTVWEAVLFPADCAGTDTGRDISSKSNSARYRPFDRIILLFISLAPF